MLLTNLTVGLSYSVSVRGATRSIYDPDNSVYFGRSSDAQKIHLRENCDQVQAFTVLEAGESPGSASSSSSTSALMDVGTGVVAGASLVAALIVLAVAAVVIKRRLQSAGSPYFVSDPNAGAESLNNTVCSASNSSSKLLATTAFGAVDGRGAGVGDGTLRSKACLTPIPAAKFLQHVECLRQSDGFRREFEALEEWEAKRVEHFKRQTESQDPALCCKSN